MFARGNTACCISTLGYWDLRSDAYLKADHCRFLRVNHLSDYSADQMEILPNVSFHYILKVLWGKFKFARGEKMKRREGKAVVSSAKVPTLRLSIFSICDRWCFIQSLAGRGHHELWLGKAWLASSKGKSLKTLKFGKKRAQCVPGASFTHIHWKNVTRSWLHAGHNFPV